MQPQALQNIFTNLPWVHNRSKRLSSAFVSKEMIFEKWNANLLSKREVTTFSTPLTFSTIDHDYWVLRQPFFPNPFQVTEKFGSISFAWLDRYNYKSHQNNNISPYLGPPISGDNIHALYIISTLRHTSLQLVWLSNLPFWCELGAKACKTAISCFPCTYLVLTKQRALEIQRK